MSKSHKGRIITLVVEITQDVPPDWMWDFGDNDGANIFCIAEGNHVQKLADLQNLVDDLAIAATKLDEFPSLKND